MRPPSAAAKSSSIPRITGYQEVFTDPSYSGQIVILTNPQIGNYGTSADRQRSRRGHTLKGLVVREFSPIASNWRSRCRGRYLPHRRRRPDRRRSRHARAGPPPAHARRDARRALRASKRDAQKLVEKARGIPVHGRARSGHRVSTPGILRVDRDRSSSARPRTCIGRPAEPRFHVVAYDFGIKHNILRRLVQVGLPRHRGARAHHAPKTCWR